MIRKYIVVSLMLLLALSVSAQDESRTEYNFLRLPVSAHCAALGGENVTMVDDDASMMFANPALLIGASPKTIGLNYMKYMSGCNYASASYNDVISQKWCVAGGVQYMGYGSMSMRDADNTDLGTFSAMDLAFNATLGYELAKNLAGGITAKYVYGNIGSYKSMAVAVDLGLNWYLPSSDWSFGFMVKNLGGQVKAYDETFEKMPLDVQLGVTKRLASSPLRFSLTLVDLNHLDYKAINHLVIGLDLLFSNQIYVAGGYNFRRADELSTINSDGKASSHGAGLSFGAGISLSRFKLNVAYSKYHVSSSSIVANIAYSL